MNRRALLRGSAGFAAAALLPGASFGLETPGAFRRIPATGLPIPAVGLGSWVTFNVGSDPELLEQSRGVVEAFVDEGGGMIDSSPMYGSSQATIGYALARIANPEAVFSADKIWTSASEADAQLQVTRSRWGIGRFDLLQVHNLVDWEANLAALFARKAGGAPAYVGITTSHGRRHRDLEQIMADEPIDFVQLTYNLADRDAEERLLPLAREKGIAVIVNRPFRRGQLVRRLQGKPLPALAGELGAGSWAQLLIKFILAHPAVTCVIPATTREDHVRENKLAAAGPVPDPAMRRSLVAYFRDL